MTTKVIIKHAGPEHADVVVSAINPETGAVADTHRLVYGQEVTLGPVYADRALLITEMGKPKPEPVKAEGEDTQQGGAATDAQ